MARILLNKSHLFHNLQLIESKIKDKNKIAVVLKDNAYGHGIVEIGTLCKEYGVRNAVVHSVAEAEKIVTLFDNILILADKQPPSYSHTFHMTINCINDIELMQKNTKVQLKVDTGMHRNGVAIEELEEAILGIYNKGLILSGVFTHHKSADELSSVFFWQKNNFKKVKKEVIKICEKLFLPIPIFHSSNSSATFRDNSFDDDWVRVGIALYGYLDTNPIFGIPKLKPVLSLYVNKLSSRKLLKNQCIGYGGTYTAQEDMDVSTYDTGYGHGFLRLNERKKFFTPEGYEVLGRVSMDNLSLNTTKDEICLFNNAWPLAKAHDTITYEIITSLKPDIPREITS
ncbi:alanine racemase [Candidatus Marinarcus aquaticus]|uniref:Alanine racemase n=1 Tax=Candidatus Marinarcus aquaticus TaxID=2044504 RepID=A0A4Q0XT97_9BACT|nr:alanine racemase [Candidatus Marinarcus aquaticus]RXJ60730.1 alanine racemase [Candidatus Marinarcus aquaticus]